MSDAAAALPRLPASDDDRVAAAAELPRRSFVAHHMAMPWSIHVRGAAARDSVTAARAREAFALVERLDHELSPFRADSALTAYRTGLLTLDEAPESLRTVHRLAGIAREVTGGVFDAWGWRDGFDPTGLTKGWAIAAALDTLSDLVDAASDVAVVASGDLAVRSPSGLPWRVGIEDPRERGRLLGHVDVVDGGVATSGTAARGAHVVDARYDRPRSAVRVLSATVVAADIVDADVWATTAVALGDDAWVTVRRVPGTAGLVMTDDGLVHRWGLEPGSLRA